MFPFAIVNEFGSNIEKLFLRYANRLNKIIFEELKKRYVSDELRLDSDPILEMLENLKKKHGEWIEQDVLKKEIEKNLDLIDDWSRKKLNEGLEKQREILKEEGVSGEEIDRRVPLIPKESAKKTIPLASERIQLTQNEMYRKHFEKVRDIINDGIILGKKPEEITKEILKATDMDAKRARFWAEDQLALFLAEQRRVQALREGYTHYRWVISRINTRPSHAIHDGKIYSWSVGVNNLTRSGARHPGEDYRCHCVAELVKPEEASKLGLTPESPRLPQSTSEIVKNYEGTEEERFAKGKEFIDEWMKKLKNVFSNSVKQVQNAEIVVKNEIKKAPKFKTTREAEKWAKTNNIADIIDYTGLDVDVANAINESIYEAIQEFPELRKNFQFIGSIQARIKLEWERKVNIYFKNLAKPEMTTEQLNKLYAKCKRMVRKRKVDKKIAAEFFPREGLKGVTFNRNWKKQSLIETLKENVKNKFHPEGTETIKSLIDHEIGHMLDDLLDITNDFEIIKLYEEYIDEKATTNEEKYKKLTDNLSMYAWKNRASNKMIEATAEAYAEYKNNPNPRKIAKTVGERIKQKYKERFYDKR